MARARESFWLLTMPLLVGGLLMPAAASAKSCSVPGADRVWLSGDIVVLRNANYVDRDVYFACWQPSGKVRRIGVARTGSSSASTLSGFVARGSWLAWGVAGRGAATQLRSFNVRSGAGGLVVRRASVALADRDGPLPVLDPPHYAVAGNGGLGWVVTATVGDRSLDAIYVCDGRGGSSRVDQAPAGTLDRLRAGRNTLRWRHGGRPRSVKLVGAPRPGG